MMLSFTITEDLCFSYSLITLETSSKEKITQYLKRTPKGKFPLNIEVLHSAKNFIKGREK